MNTPIIRDVLYDCYAYYCGGGEVGDGMQRCECFGAFLNYDVIIVLLSAIIFAILIAGSFVKERRQRHERAQQ